MPRSGRGAKEDTIIGFLRAAGAAGALLLAIHSAVAAQTSPPPAVPGEPAPGFQPRIVREGTVSIQFQGGYGGFIGGSDFADDFSSGPNLGVRLRYRTGRESAIGLAFEALRFDAKDDPVENFDPKQVQSVVTMAEFYQYFSIRKRMPKYFSLGAGLVQHRIKLRDDETEFPGDGGVFSLGLGTEYWWKRSITFELSGRYYGMVRGHEGSTLISHAAEAAVGVNFYTSR